MALNDDDKKFIKDNVNKKLENLEKKVDNIQSKSFKDAYKPGQGDAGKKLTKLQQEAQEKKDRALLIQELTEKNKKGEATLAEKIELMSQTIKSSIPNDFKDGVKALSDSVKGGASQAGRGLAHLNERLMMSNPLTAMLYQNRDILQALGDVGVGSLKMGWGVAKGIGKGAAGMVNAAANIFKKKKAKKEIEEEAKVVEEVLTTSKQKEEEKEEKTASEYILEMHDFLFNDLKPFFVNDKKEKSFMSKGLSGIGKTFKSIAGVIDLIASKQKLILTGVLAGVVAIVALKKWFESGKLADLIRGAKSGVKQAVNNINLNKDGVEKSAQKIDNLYGDVSNGLIKGQAEVDYANKTIDKNNLLSLGNEKSYKKDEKQSLNNFYDNFAKQGDISKGAAQILKNNGLGQAINKPVKMRSYSNSKGATKLSFPVKTKIIDISINENPERGVDILIEKAEINSVKDLGQKATTFGGQVRLLITNILKLYAPKNKVIPAKTLIGLLGPYGKILGPVEEFMKGDEFDKYTNNNINSKEIDSNYVEWADEKGTIKAKEKTFNDLSKKYNIEHERQKMYNNPIKYTKNAFNELSGKKEVNEPVPNPVHDEMGSGPGTKPMPSANEKKAEDQAKEIKQKEQEVKDQQKKTQQAQDKANQNPAQIAMIQQGPTRPDMPSDMINPNLAQCMTNSNISAIS